MLEEYRKECNLTPLFTKVNSIMKDLKTSK
jgi:hypothetical protein